MINKCLFPAAGYGTRFLPATKAMPKEMMPVVNKPLIQYGVEEALQAGISSMCIVTGRGKHALMDHFDKSYELEHQIAGTDKDPLLDNIRTTIGAASYTFTRQSDMLGLGHAILTGQEMVGLEPFAVILADDLCVNDSDGVLAQLVKVYEEFRCSVIAVQEVDESDTQKYGIVSGREIKEGLYCIDNLVEKPEPGNAPGNLAIVGRYILTPDIFDILANTPPGTKGEIQLTDALLSQTQSSTVLACKFEGKRFDCGTVEGFIDATNHCYKKYFID
ncbi:UTP--glucose-1-phosphate uridylyltransferase [Veronia nyctiphanis]|uniref:UTP--glucose-1-phosphate uridylyltransferase n=1 Tax=Veronia nyctiphanis TaxID=1278244 RepID=A0A4Q0YMI1_9GAMM|nr:UTP--glucose-1-phosphate uridylyltransferase GalU [Veronia nyctiphanis]RXJ71956.1 UTP--glucose-1-phosphate uridylyltransferase [Veronia nyctiphanis]